MPKQRTDSLLNSLELFLLLAKNSISAYEASNHSAAATGSLLTCLSKINEQIDLNKSKKGTWTMIVDSGFLAKLTKLNPVELDIKLFDQQTSCIKKLLLFLKEYDIEDKLNERFYVNVTLSFNSYLEHFSLYTNMERYQIVFLKRILATVIECFHKHSEILEQFLKNKNGKEEASISSFTTLPSNFKIYDFLIKFIFVDGDDSQFHSFIDLLSVNNCLLVRWLLENSNISKTFTKRFTKIYKNSCALSKTTKEFNAYLKFFYMCAQKTSSDLRQNLLRSFKVNFFDPLLQSDFNKVQASYTFGILELSRELGLKEFVVELVDNGSFDSFVSNFKSCITEDCVHLFGVLERICRTNEAAVIRLFGIEEVKPIASDEIRSMAATVCQDDHPNVVLDEILKNMMAVKATVFPSISDRTKTSQLIYFYLINLFQNKPDLNSALVNFMSSILPFLNFTGDEKFCHLISFLFEAYKNYLGIVGKINEEKYDTLRSFGESSESSVDCIFPKLLLCPSGDKKAYYQGKNLNPDYLELNIGIFELLIIKLYANNKTKCLLIFGNASQQKSIQFVP